MVILALVLVVLALAAAGRSRGGRSQSAEPRATNAGEGHQHDVRADPTHDRPAGPRAEGNMDPGAGVFHTDDQDDSEPSHGAEPRSDRHSPSGSDTDR